MSEGSEQDSQTHFVVKPVGRVESTLTDPAEAPSQGDEGAPSAWLVFDPDVYDAARDLQIGDRIIVIAWLHRAQRDVLRTFPRDWVDAPHIRIFKLRAPKPACSSSLINSAMFSLTFLMSAPAAALVFIASCKFFSVRFRATPWSAYSILQPHV